MELRSYEITSYQCKVALNYLKSCLVIIVWFFLLIALSADESQIIWNNKTYFEIPIKPFISNAPVLVFYCCYNITMNLVM